MYKFLKPIMMLAIASVFFTSCGGDDENEDLPSPVIGNFPSELVGKWDEQNSAYSTASNYWLKADGSGKGYEANVLTGRLNGSWAIKWTYKDHILKIVDNNGDIETLKVIDVDATTLRVRPLDEHGNEVSIPSTYHKVNKFFWE